MWLVCGVAVCGLSAAKEWGQAPVPAPAPVQHIARPIPPARDPHTPGYVKAKELPDGAVPPANKDGNFIIGPTHPGAPEMTVGERALHGTVVEFTMSSAESKIYPGIARDPGTFGTPDPKDPAKLVVTTSHPAPYTRKVAVYVPQAVCARGRRRRLLWGRMGRTGCCFTALDGLIAEKKVPAMVAISIGNGSGDAQGSERGLEYDTMSGEYAEFVETGSAAARGGGGAREADEGSGGAGDDGRQLGRVVRADHGVVSPGALSPGADVFGDVYESAVAVGIRRRRMGRGSFMSI